MLDISQNDILLNEFVNGNDRYLMVFRCGKNSPISGMLGLNSTNTGTPITVNAQIKDLPDGTYTINAAYIGALTDDQFRATGIQLDNLTERELRLFKLTKL